MDKLFGPLTDSELVILSDKITQEAIENKEPIEITNEKLLLLLMLAEGNLMRYKHPEVKLS